jgi:hypothetical protein
MTLREAAQQALEALITATPVKAKDPQMQADAINALRTALADQSEQALEMVEPSAYISGYVQGHPVIKTVDETVLLPVGTAFYTTPPQRKPLTDGQIGRLCGKFDARHSVAIGIAREIERAHGIGEKG